MITIKDLAKNLITKHQVSASDGELFIQQMVEVINDGLLRDRQVKIKGFGTFKLQTMKERASINVNTGERVTISEHDKVTFTPDNTMKDIINKPFAQFETVIVADDSPLLNESFEIDPEDDDDVDEEPVEMPKPAVVPEPVKNVEVPKPEPIETPKPEPVEVPQPEPTTEKEPEPVVEKIEEPIVDEKKPEPPVEEEEPEPIDEVDETEENSCNRQYPHCRNIFIYYGILINIIVALIAFAAGYFIRDWHLVDSAPQQAVVAKAPADSKPAAKQKTQDKNDAQQQAKPQVAKPQEDKVQEDKPLTEYDSDPRVRTGAYYILGTDQVVTVKKGQTLKSISKAYLGSDMECYLEAYNYIKEVKAGDKVKIPRLKLKKHIKKHNK